MSLIILIIVASVVAVATAVIAIVKLVRAANLKAAERLEALDSAARALGLSFSRDKAKKTDVAAVFPKAAPLNVKSASMGHEMGGILSGSQQLSVRLFDHQYVVSTGKSTMTVINRVGMAAAPAHWPDLSITPAAWRTWLPKSWRKRGLALENEAFNDRYVVKTQDEAFGLLFMTLPMQTWLASLPPKPARSMHVGRGAIAFVETGGFSAENLGPFLTSFNRFVDLVPAELWPEGGEAS